MRNPELQRSEEMKEASKARGNEKKYRIEAVRADPARSKEWEKATSNEAGAQFRQQSKLPDFIKRSLPDTLIDGKANELGLDYARLMHGIQKLNELDAGKHCREGKSLNQRKCTRSRARGPQLIVNKDGSWESTSWRGSGRSI